MIRMLLLLGLMLPALALTQDNLPQALTDVQARTTRTNLTAGDVVELSIQAPTETANGAEPAMAAKLKEGPVEWGTGRILYWKPVDPNTGKIVVGLTSYTPGQFQIGPISFVKDGKAVFSSQPKTVEYGSVGGDKSQDDIYPPVGSSVPRWVWVLLSLLLLALVLAAIFLVARWYQRRNAKLKALAAAPKVLSPLEEFEKVRAETDARSYVSKGHFKPHYFALSDAAKRYLGKALRFDAEERTTRELIRELEALGVSEKLREQWQKVFEEMDVTKFTDQLPDVQMARTLSERLTMLVRATK